MRKTHPDSLWSAPNAVEQAGWPVCSAIGANFLSLELKCE